MSEMEVVQGTAPGPRRVKKDAEAPKRAKDAHLPGLEPVVNAAVHRAIEEYVEARDHRMQLTKVEVEKRAALMRVMKEAGLADYVVDGHEAHIEHGEETVKAKLVSEDEEGEGEGGS